MDGFTYERSAIEKWFRSNPTSPMTRATIVPTVVPNMSLRSQIAAWDSEWEPGERVLHAARDTKSDTVHVKGEYQACMHGMATPAAEHETAAAETAADHAAATTKAAQPRAKISIKEKLAARRNSPSPAEPAAQSTRSCMDVAATPT